MLAEWVRSVDDFGPEVRFAPVFLDVEVAFLAADFFANGFLAVGFFGVAFLEAAFAAGIGIGIVMPGMFVC